MQQNTRALYKYANRKTGEISFHEKEIVDAPPHMVLVRPPDPGAPSAVARQQFDPPKKVSSTEGK
jgi:hypothetical protein